jgi:5-methylcytosine-specific restriction protein A
MRARSIYDTRNWARLRRAKLEQEPFCRHCAKRGKLVVAHVVDHIVPMSKGGEPYPPLEGLQSLCERCHNSKSSQETKRGNFLLRGFSADGLPIDTKHPFYS